MAIRAETEDVPIVWRLFADLRARRLGLGPGDYGALRHAMRKGFGLASREALRDLCVTLWAKSGPEAEIVAARFDALGLPDWNTAEARPVPVADPTVTPPPPITVTPPPGSGTTPPPVIDREDVVQVRQAATALRAIGRLPQVTSGGVQWSDRSFVFAPQYPVSYREAAQTWRRLRRPVRIGPAIELDVDATLSQRSRRGIVSAPVLVPRRRNIARLLLLVDRMGSMTPFHAFVDEMLRAIVVAANLQRVVVRYFKNLPSGGADPEPLRQLTGQLSPSLDAILSEIQPIDLGSVCARPDLVDVASLEAIVADMGAGAGVAIVSDGGAARGSYQPRRLLDTVAFLKTLRARLPRVVWLNPLDRADWAGTTAAEVARHTPMFSMTKRSDLHAAVDVLRGRPVRLEHPL